MFNIGDRVECVKENGYHFGVIGAIYHVVDHNHLGLHLKEQESRFGLNPKRFTLSSNSEHEKLKDIKFYK